ncbi:uncharacterized protein GGS22DRAFT_190892 [Annulohypoxylon maeteangense]|uniref:uncharacterized protein n=1 Tax=Annulohypoxylon maeteangense TaxID=1927788 RepID=UPI002007691C|nr:uncharacterized protein GGS22DRAFT_190892 [Annulohypoxylon maeteangense]KAI0882915.1 hypothetical protein GGS22DRAFT_190892 [Annulohypoxylon maeteangense]
MVLNKKRLYLALYPSGNTSERQDLKYHLAFIIGPKNEYKEQVPGMRFHIKNLPGGGWRYAEDVLPDVQTSVRLLVRVLIAKITNESQLIEVFRNTPIFQKDPTFNCRTWVIDALSRISNNRKVVGTSQLDWKMIEERARTYVAMKTVVGRFGEGQDMRRPKPTWDMLEDKEIVA